MRILITGSDGFIGSYLKTYLEKRGHIITGTVFRRSAINNEIEFDITLIKNFEKLRNKTFDVIINTIGIVDQKQPKKLIFAVNFEGIKRLIDWSLDIGCKHFIQISSIAVYGLKTIGEYRTEESTKRYEGRFAIPYMRSKAKAEKYIESSGISYTLLRLPAVLGRNDTVLSSTIISRMQQRKFFFSGKNERMISTLYIQNLGSLIEKVLEIGPKNDFFNCTDFHIKWADFIQEYTKKLSINMNYSKKSFLSVFTHFKDKGYLLMITYSKFGAHFPNEKIKRIFNWDPKFTWQDGVSEAVQSIIRRKFD